jgi:hypothetical protein
LPAKERLKTTFVFQKERRRKAPKKERPKKPRFLKKLRAWQEKQKPGGLRRIENKQTFKRQAAARGKKNAPLARGGFETMIFGNDGLHGDGKRKRSSLQGGSQYKTLPGSDSDAQAFTPSLRLYMGPS